MAGDGQVTIGDTIMKHQARKVRRLYDAKVITADYVRERLRDIFEDEDLSRRIL